MPEVVIYHNPRCSKSREALRLLQEAGVTPRVVDYQKTPLDEAEISRLIDLLGARLFPGTGITVNSILPGPTN